MTDDKLLVADKPATGGAPPRTRTWLLAMAGCACVHLGVKALRHDDDAATVTPVGGTALAPGQVPPTGRGAVDVGWARPSRPVVERADGAP